MPKSKVPSVTIRKSFFCDGEHEKKFYLTLAGTETVTGAFIKVGSAGNCTCCLMGGLSGLIALSAKKGATSEEIAKKLRGIMCSARVPGGSTSCLDWVAEEITSFNKKESDEKKV
jgi:hypothetical protein